MRPYLTSAIVLVFVFLGCPEWLTERGALCYLCYPLFHANIFHLILNCMSLWLALDPRRDDNVKCLLVSYAVSIAVYPLSAMPVVGVSNMLFAIAGMRTPPLSSRWWKSGNTIFFLVMMLAFLFVPRVSAVTHIASFSIGVGIACLSREFIKLKRDVERLERMG